MNEFLATNYPEDALLNNPKADVISTTDVKNLGEAFRERVRRNPNCVAYGQYDDVTGQWITYTWSDIAVQVAKWQQGLSELSLEKGDRIAICYRNSIEWIIFDQAAFSLGLIVVPLYTSDRAENTAYILENCQAKLVLLSDVAMWQAIDATDFALEKLETVLLLCCSEQEKQVEKLGKDSDHKRVSLVKHWLPKNVDKTLENTQRETIDAQDLASIIYTSGTTGRPKGVMLTHHNMLTNAYAGLRSIAITPDTVSLSFLPLSHTLERTVGYYGSMLSGAKIYFNRSIEKLVDDLQIVKPSALISVPRIFERVYNQISESLLEANIVKKKLFSMAINVGWHRFEYQQKRAKWHPKIMFYPILDKLVGQKVRNKLGGNLTRALVGGAPMSAEVTKTFISLGVELLQGYGLTETSPIVSSNTEKNNKPGSIGLPIRGVEVKICGNDELCVKGPNVMQGYWRNAKATAETIDNGWLKTGDRARLDEEGFLHIIGRIKEIIVMANGEKVPPSDIEAAITRNAIFEQAILLGEQRSYLSAIVVLNESVWAQIQQQNHWQEMDLQSDEVQQFLLEKVSAQMAPFPGYAQVRKLHVTLEEWGVDNGLLTPTLKLKRVKINEYYKAQIDSLYEGHGVKNIGQKNR